MKTGFKQTIAALAAGVLVLGGQASAGLAHAQAQQNTFDLSIRWRYNDTNQINEFDPASKGTPVKSIFYCTYQGKNPAGQLVQPIPGKYLWPVIQTKIGENFQTQIKTDST